METLVHLARARQQIGRRFMEIKYEEFCGLDAEQAVLDDIPGTLTITNELILRPSIKTCIGVLYCSNHGAGNRRSSACP